MAKELPYFKFEPNEWENGNIQICSRESKGLFIDLCAVYWSRLGELPYALALQKHCNGNPNALQELENNDIIGVSDGQIIIEFLDEQLNEFQETSEKRRNAANKRWSNASAMQVQCKSNAIREEKSKEDKKKEEWFIDWFNDSMVGIKGVKGKYKLISKVKSQLHARIKEGYKSEDFKTALKAIIRNDYHKETNYQYLTPEFLTRSTTLEKWCNVEEKKDNNAHLYMI